ncbi:hypothetical protein NLG07_01600 [Alteromonas sp. LMIT006]|uniref:hypothetical protein n=1 Tax=Alteromonadaceae TaxID=72275 RepID=UPI0020CA3585|nr:hypothetical protein [Alteromonas sp. LMIT006]UTP72957.1 hypothetical protein NLG07_01600 [Alteromonas sp. LMIT006]
MSSAVLSGYSAKRRFINSAQLQNIQLDDIVRYSACGAFREFIKPIDWVSMVFRFPKLLSLPKGHGEPVVLVPGYFTDEKTLCVLGQFLKFLNYRVFQWDVKHNAQELSKDVALLEEHLVQLMQNNALPKISLVGYGLGGLLCRAIAQRETIPLKQLITLGTPLNLENPFTPLSKRYAQRIGVDLDSLLNNSKAICEAKLTLPVTILYAPDDEFVTPEATRDKVNEHANHHLINGSHVNYTHNAKVWETIASTLVTV